MELYSAPSNPAPAGAEVVLIPTADRQRLRAARWMLPQARGTICIFTGRAEYIEKYFETVRQLLQRGFAVAAIDWRGQGGSDRELTDGAKGHIDDFSFYLDDLTTFETLILNPFCPKPYYALGHSMGGAILLAHAGARHFPFERQILTAPMIDIYGPVPNALAHKVVRFLTRIGFGLNTIPFGRNQIQKDAIFVGNRLTGDPQRHARALEIIKHAPRLAIDAPTVAWTAAAYDLMKNLMDPDFLRGIRTPTLIFAAGDDRIVSTPAIVKAAQTIQTGKIIVLPDARHEILQESDAIRALFWKAFDAFIPSVEPSDTSLEPSDIRPESPAAIPGEAEESIRTARMAQPEAQNPEIIERKPRADRSDALL